MTLQQAQDYVRDYQLTLDGQASRGGRKDPETLPASKIQIIQAIKLELANLYYINCADEERVRPLIHAGMFIDTFTRNALDSTVFIRLMRDRKDEIEGFFMEILNIRRNDPFYWQRVYALAGVSCETKSTTFFETLKDRLRRLRKTADEETTTQRKGEKRFILR